MHTEEAKWIRSKIDCLTREELSPVLNIGSSTNEFRVKSQPYIDSFIFEHLRKKKVRVIHQDIKDDDGVDMTGDLTDQSFLDRLTQLKPKLILCNNLLEHLENRELFAKALCSMIPPSGYLIITVPSEYPRHMDPIDTMYRPTVSELAGQFPTMKMLDSELLNVGTVWHSYSNNGFKLLRLLMRVAVPFIKYSGWVTSIHKLGWLFKDRKIACVFLRAGE